MNNDPKSSESDEEPEENEEWAGQWESEAGEN